MKKRLLFTLLIFIEMIIFTTGCEVENVSDGSKIKVTNSDGEIEETTVYDLCKLYDENERKFSKKYEFEKVVFESKVQKVLGPTNYTNIDSETYDPIKFENGILLLLQTEKFEIVDDLEVGDTLHVESYIKDGVLCPELALAGGDPNYPSETYEVSKGDERELTPTVIKKVNK